MPPKSAIDGVIETNYLSAGSFFEVFFERPIGAQTKSINDRAVLEAFRRNNITTIMVGTDANEFRLHRRLKLSW